MGCVCAVGTGRGRESERCQYCLVLAELYPGQFPSNKERKRHTHRERKKEERERGREAKRKEQQNNIKPTECSRREREIDVWILTRNSGLSVAQVRRHAYRVESCARRDACWYRVSATYGILSRTLGD